MTTTQKDEKVISEVATVLQTFGHRSTSTPTGGTGGTSGTEDGGTEAGSENQNAVFTITFEEFMKWFRLRKKK